MKDVTQAEARELLKEVGSERKLAMKLGINRHAVKRLLKGEPVKVNGGGRSILGAENLPAKKIAQELSLQGCAVTETSLMLPKGFTIDQAAIIVNRLVNASYALPWWIGDCLAQTEVRHGEMYTQLIPEANRAKQTLMNYHWVAGKVEISRRREVLSWQHHVEVAKLEPKEQEKWLKIAADKELSVRELRFSIGLGKVVTGKELDEMSGKGSGLKEPTFEKITHLFERWHKKEFPNNGADLERLTADKLAVFAEELKPILDFAEAIKARLGQGKTVDVKTEAA